VSSFYCEDITINRIASFIQDHPTHPARDHVFALCFIEPAQFYPLLADSLRILNRKALMVRYGDDIVKDYDDGKWPPFKYEFIPDIREHEFVYAAECWLYQCAEGDIPDTNKLWQAINSTKKDIIAQPRFDQASYQALKNGEYWV